uniref:Uncharacterized protein n=1 Tax=Physcomitrium patens TaxID=3218 RepID=A0A2K1L224_PHYPA|nr:hypothetical protein PHYPA_002856 [Physcomitrium patens]
MLGNTLLFFNPRERDCGEDEVEDGEDKETEVLTKFLCGHGVRRDALTSGPWLGDVTIGTLTAGVDFSRPLRPKWSGSAGINFQQAGARDEHGSVKVVDMYGGPLTFSGRACDDMLVAKLESAESMTVLEVDQMNLTKFFDKEDKFDGEKNYMPLSIVV